MMFTQQRVRIMTVCVGISLVLCMGAGPLPSLPEQASCPVMSPAAYLAEKAASHRLVLLGTQHSSRSIHDLVVDLLPSLVRDAGVNTLFVEIPSDQQEAIECFRTGLCPADSISIHQIVASQGYLNVLCTARELRLDIIAVDNGEDQQVSRDRWMASRISDHLDRHPAARGLVVVGNSHVLKEVAWTCGENPSLADYLKPLDPFSVLMWPGAPVSSGPQALNSDPKIFLGVKDPTLMTMNTEARTCLATCTDGVILLPD